MFVKVLSPLLSIKKSMFSTSLINVPFSPTLLLMLLLLSVSDMTFSAIFYSFRHFNVDCCDTFWRNQPCFDANRTGWLVMPAKSPIYSYPLQVTGTIHEIVFVVKYIALGKKIMKNNSKYHTKFTFVKKRLSPSSAVSSNSVSCQGRRSHCGFFAI